MTGLARGWSAPGPLGVLIALIGVVLFAAIATPNGHSYGFNMSWLVAFDAALGEGTLYPRHLPALWFGLGGLDFFFYGPLPFYVAAGPASWLCGGCTPQTVFGLTGGLLWAASGLAFWYFARRFLAPWPAFWATLFYVLMPYHLGIDWIVRQAAGEFAAYVFVPVVAVGLLDAMEARRVGPLLALGFAGLLFSHLPTALLAVHVFAIVLLAWGIRRPGALPAAAGRGLVLGLAGLALAAVYWLPAVALLPDVSPDALSIDALSPTSWFLLGTDILPDTLLKAAILSSLVGVLAAAALAVVLSQGSERERLALWALLPAGIALLLNTSASAPLWEHWIIGRVQFPFRLTVFSDLAGALAGGVLVSIMLRAAGQRRLLSVAGLAALGLSAVVALPLLPARILDGIGQRGTPVTMTGAPEYLPPVFYDPLETVLSGEDAPIWEMTRLVRERVAAGRYEGTLAVESAPRHWTAAPASAGPAVLPIPYWRHLRAEAGGVPLTLEPDAATGLVSLDVPSGAREVALWLPRHWSERAGLAASFAGLLAIGAMGVGSLRRPAGESRTS